MDIKERSAAIIERANRLTENSNFHIKGFDAHKTYCLLQAILEDHDRQVYVIHNQPDPQVETLKDKLAVAELTIKDYHEFDKEIEAETGVDIDLLSEHVNHLVKERDVLYDALVRIDQTLTHALHMQNSPIINTIWMKDAVEHEPLFDFITTTIKNIDSKKYRKDTV